MSLIKNNPTDNICQQIDELKKSIQVLVNLDAEGKIIYTKQF